MKPRAITLTADSNVQIPVNITLKEGRIKEVAQISEAQVCNLLCGLDSWRGWHNHEYTIEEDCGDNGK